jgi:hypothetical protein
MNSGKQNVIQILALWIQIILTEQETIPRKESKQPWTEQRAIDIPLFIFK